MFVILFKFTQNEILSGMTGDFQWILGLNVWFLWLCRKIKQHHNSDMLLPEPQPHQT